jgi:hypothetical protein
MHPAHRLYLLADLRNHHCRQGHYPILLPLAVMHSQQPGVEIEAMNAKLEALREGQSASVKERSD